MSRIFFAASGSFVKRAAILVSGPLATQTSGLLTSSTTLNPLIAACCTGTFPDTAVTPATSSSGERRARIRARASSIPPSMSMMTRLGLFDPRTFLEQFYNLLGGQHVCQVPEFYVLQSCEVGYFCERFHRVPGHYGFEASEETIGTSMPHATVSVQP